MEASRHGHFHGRRRSSHLQPPRRDLAQRYHSAGKEAERASRTDDASNAEITIRTLHDLGEVSADAIRSYWHRNFMVDVDKPSEDMLKGRKTGMWRRRACELELYQCALWSRCHAWGLPPRCEPYCVSLIGLIDSIEGKTILFSLHLLSSRTHTSF